MDYYILVRVPIVRVEQGGSSWLEVQPIELVENTIPVEDRLGLAESVCQADIYQMEFVAQISAAIETDTPNG